MKANEIVEVVEERFETIDKLSYKILKEFDREDIHDFRIEVKKLRAFLRLLDIKKNDEAPLIPKLLKTFYGYVGIISDVQLHKHNFFKCITDDKIDKPVEYLKLLDDEENYWKKEAEELMGHNNFHDVKEKILIELPRKLEKTTIKKFVQSKLDEFKKYFKNLHDETALHMLRKILKDLLYTYDYVKDHAALPKAISGKDELNSLIQTLGNLRDKCIQLEFLQPEYLDKIKDENEKVQLLKIKNEFERGKELIKQQLQHKFDEFSELMKAR